MLPDKRKNLLVPVSGGVSSVVLLYILDQQIKKQRKKTQDRLPYNLHVLVVDISSVAPYSPSEGLVELLRKRFPDYIQSFEPLSAVFTYDVKLPESLEQLGFIYNRPSGDTSDEAKLQRLFSCLGSPTSRTDVQSILLARLVGAFAKSHGCEAVLWAHSDSKLAATALSSVAKGRGGSVPLQTNDGPSPWGPTFNYPVRDLFKPELESYARLAESSLSDIIIWGYDNVTSSVSVKNSAIDDLLTAYITSQGEKYPSIMANVVRTSSKLQAPKQTLQTMVCSLCGTPSSQNADSFSAIPNSARPDSLNNLCYGCSQIKREFLNRQ